MLYLALLLHDTGKGLAGTDHVHSSLQLQPLRWSGWACQRRRADGLLPGRDHLEMSSTLRRRDIYDPQTVRELANKVGTPERLKMLTLMTLADIKAVNPEALTPWKAENLWRLYTGDGQLFQPQRGRRALSCQFAANKWSASPHCSRIAARNC